MQVGPWCWGEALCRAGGCGEPGEGNSPLSGGDSLSLAHLAGGSSLSSLLECALQVAKQGAPSRLCLCTLAIMSDAKGGENKES